MMTMKITTKHMGAIARHLADVRDATADACDAILRRRAGGEP